MKILATAFCALLLCTVTQLGYADGSSTKIAINQLLQNEHAYLGKYLSVHSCLIFTPHGAFIEPCGNHDWRRIIILDIPESKDDLIPHTFFKRLHTNFAAEVEADVAGTLAQKTVKDYFGKPRMIFVLRLDDISNPKIFRKF